ncbi:pyridoxamine 5'-phosphate oxidase family protein [Myxococcota bacterium]|nr:pyridoxamine 5'-phosphate oxidase family protein [Myxococcota bacterium]
MAKVFDELDDPLIAFIHRQHLFFVASAPDAHDGLINLSPKGRPGLAILSPRRVAYLDLVGSGIETTAHLGENGRIVVMFCAFEGPPRIVRLHGRGEAIEPADERWDGLAQHFPQHDGARAIICIDLLRISDSCGYGVPRFDYLGERDQLDRWVEKKGPDGLIRYQEENNRHSIDGLPGLRRLSEASDSSEG